MKSIIGFDNRYVAPQQRENNKLEHVRACVRWQRFIQYTTKNYSRYKHFHIDIYIFVLFFLLFSSPLHIRFYSSAARACIASAGEDVLTYVISNYCNIQLNWITHGISDCITFEFFFFCSATEMMISTLYLFVWSAVVLLGAGSVPAPSRAHLAHLAHQWYYVWRTQSARIRSFSSSTKTHKIPYLILIDLCRCVLVPLHMSGCWFDCILDFFFREIYQVCSRYYFALGNFGEEH